jgi:ribonucleoside-diphosphate reductase subunit M2
MKDLALKTPTKNAKKVEKLEFDIFDDAPREESPDTIDSCVAETEVDPEVAELEELRKQFVGDVDITEGSHRSLSPSATRSNEDPRLDQEPLLIESKRRFVLFPIQYPEVCPMLRVSCAVPQTPP